jgi:hypothetical protein
MKTLLISFVSKYTTFFPKVAYTNVFKGLQLKYDQLSEEPIPDVQKAEK